MEPCIHESADGGKSGRLREHLGIRTDSDLKILAPGPLSDQNVLKPRGFRRTGLEPPQIVTHQAQYLGSNGCRRAGIASRPLFNHALKHGHGKGHAGSFDHLKIDGGKQPRTRRIPAIGHRVRNDLVKRPHPFASGCPQKPGWVVHGREPAHGGGSGRNVEDTLLTDRHDRRSDAWAPDPPGKRTVEAVDGQSLTGFAEGPYRWTHCIVSVHVSKAKAARAPPMIVRYLD